MFHCMKTTSIHSRHTELIFEKRTKKKTNSHVIALLVIHNTQTDKLCGENNNQEQFFYSPSCMLL